MSYLIYTDAFDALPEPARSYVYRPAAGDPDRPARQRRVLDTSATADRQAVLEILLETKPGLPDEWTADQARRPTSLRRRTDRHQNGNRGMTPRGTRR